MKFLLIDQVTAITPGESISARKTLSLAEEYLADHFPGFPVLPGVLMVEALVQTGACLMRHTTDFRYSTVLLKEVKAVRYNNFVSPGKSLEITMTVRKKQENVWDFQGTGTVDGGSAVSARLALVQFNLADRNPQLAKADEAGIKHHREMFQVLWRTPPQMA